MKIYLPEKFRKLPQWIKDMAALDAIGYVEEVLRVPYGSPQYVREIEKRMEHFLNEAIEESLTASVGM